MLLMLSWMFRESEVNIIPHAGNSNIGDIFSYCWTNFLNMKNIRTERTMRASHVTVLCSTLDLVKEK